MKNRLRIILLIFAVGYSMLSCAFPEKKRVIASLNHVYYHTAPYQNDEGDIPFWVLSDRENPEISVTEFQGINVDKIHVLEVRNDSVLTEGKRYQGKYLRWHSIHFKIVEECKEDISIDSLTLNIDSEAVTYSFPIPLCIERENDHQKNGEEISLKGGTIVIGGDLIATDQLCDQTYVCRNEPIEILSISFNDILYMDQKAFRVKNGSVQESEAEDRPIILEPGDMINIQFLVRYKENIGGTGLDDTTCSVIVIYRRISDGVICTYSSPFGIQGVTTEEDAEKMAELLLKEQEEAK